MKRSKSTDAQIAFVRKQVEERAPVAEVCRKAGIAETTFYNRRKKYAGLIPSEMTLQDVIKRKLQGLLAAANLSMI